MLPDNATFVVNDEEIENPFSDYEKYEVPEPEDMFEQVTENKFCFVKAWENSEERSRGTVRSGSEDRSWFVSIEKGAAAPP